MRPTVGTTVVPNLAKMGKRGEKLMPLSQILAPPVMDPVSGFTSVSVGVGSPSGLGGPIASEFGSAFGGGCVGIVSDGESNERSS